MFRSTATIATLLFAVIVPFGCRTARKLEVTPSGAPAFDTFEAEYEVPVAASHFQRSFDDSSLPTETPSSGSAVEPVSGVAPGTVTGSQQTARLTIMCPASPAEPNEARLTLNTWFGTAEDGNVDSKSQETRQLIIPRQQVELLIIDLARAGFFDSPDPPGARSPLRVTIDGARVTRNWRTDDRLLDFAHRVFHRGRVTSD